MDVEIRKTLLPRKAVPSVTTLDRTSTASSPSFAAEAQPHTSSVRYPGYPAIGQVWRRTMLFRSSPSPRRSARWSTRAMRWRACTGCARSSRREAVPQRRAASFFYLAIQNTGVSANTTANWLIASVHSNALRQRTPAFRDQAGWRSASPAQAFRIQLIAQNNATRSAGATSG